MKKIVSNTVLLFIFLKLSACTLYDKPKINPLVIPDRFKSTTKVTNLNTPNQWWKNFNDEHLNQLVAKAIQHNVDYQIAIKNVEIAQTYVAQATSYLLPHMNLNVDAARTKLSKNAINTLGNINNASFINSVFPIKNFSEPFTSLLGFLSATYEVDIWKRIRNNINQATADVMVSAADSDVIKLSLISKLVTTYFQLLALNANLANLQQQLYFADALLKLSSSQFKSGLADAEGEDDAKNQIETIKINVSTLEKQKIILINSIGYLLGQYPEQFNFPITNSLKNKKISGLIPANLPCSMLSRRPDIREAFYQTVSYGYLEKQNIAKFLPTFNLTGNYGYSSNMLKNFISSGSIFWNYGTNILQPIFDFGLRMSEYKRSRYQFESAFLNYKNTVINAFTEVDNALSSYQKDYIALNYYQRQSAIFKNKVRIAAAKYKGGLTDDTTYLTTNLNALQNSYNLINQKFDVLEDIVRVYVTLGLGLDA